MYMCGGGCSCMCVCKCTWMCVYVCMHVQVHILLYIHKYFQARGHSKVSFLGTTFFLRWDLRLSYNSSNTLGWSTRKPQRPTCLCLLQGTGITNPHIMRDFCSGVCFVCFAYHSFWGFKSSPHVWEANTLPIWPFLQSCFKVVLLMEFSQTNLEKKKWDTTRVSPLDISVSLSKSMSMPHFCDPAYHPG